MLYKKFSPSPALQSLVYCYYVWEYDGTAAAPKEVSSPPKGFTGLVVNYKTPCQSYLGNGRWEPQPHIFVAGQYQQKFITRFCNDVGMAGVAFFPTALSHLLQIPLSEITDQRVDLELLMGQPARELRMKIVEASTPQQKVKLLENFLTERLHQLDYQPGVLDKVVDHIIEHNGMVSVSQLADQAALSDKQFRRRFYNKTGLSPKLYCRIKRFNMVIGDTHLKLPDWADAVHKLGYYDQSHLIREIRKFSGKNPSEYFSYQRHIAMKLNM